MHVYLGTTIFSDQMDEKDEKQSDSETDTESSGETPSCNRYIYKYAPHNGIVGNNDEMLIFLKKKLERKKYGS
jgi:hypothetical protein